MFLVELKITRGEFEVCGGTRFKTIQMEKMKWIY